VLVGVGGQHHALAALPLERDPVPTAQWARWAPRPVCTGAENLIHTGIQSPDRPACTKLLQSNSILNMSKCGKLCFAKVWLVMLMQYALYIYRDVYKPGGLTAFWLVPRSFKLPNVSTNKAGIFPTRPSLQLLRGWDHQCHTPTDLTQILSSMDSQPY
jgi:hypothetical protein